MSEPLFIHTVTTIPHHPDDPRKHLMSPRCWGFYGTREEAIAGLKHNVDDECGYYNYAIIERFKSGIYAESDQEQWFKYDFDSVHWVEIVKPSFSEHLINYGIG